MPYVSPPTVSATTTIGKPAIGVARFLDKRSWVDESDPGSEGIIGEFVTPSGSLGKGYRQGMTYQGKKFFPVKDFVQIVLVEQLRAAGFNARPIEEVISTNDRKAVEQAEQLAQVQFVLTGEIVEFQWEHIFSKDQFSIADMGGFKSWEFQRYSVMLPLELQRSVEGPPLLKRSFGQTRDAPFLALTENHYAEYNQALLELFGKVVTQIVSEIAAVTGSTRASASP
jgi:hypothetical protein